MRDDRGVEQFTIKVCEAVPRECLREKTSCDIGRRYVVRGRAGQPVFLLVDGLHPMSEFTCDPLRIPAFIERVHILEFHRGDASRQHGDRIFWE